MPPHESSPSLTPSTPHSGFTDLHIFLREAFRKTGLVSIPPELLQRFKQCPLQDIQCPNIGAFARLFEGTHFNNRFRLEANSFVYTVQILFHLRPNLVQERTLYSLMVPVRLLKDEKEASNRLSELAGREIDRYAVARKRTLISTRLVPWLLKHFSQDSTIVRLKIVAAQFLFHLLQGDEEAKGKLSSAPQRERWSLRRAISASPELSLRILAANVLREALLAQLDPHLFWSPEAINSNEPQLPSSFIADAQWLHSIVQYFRDYDGLRTDLDERRAKTYELLHLRAGSLAFSDVASTIPVNVSDRLLFIIPANQNRPLQILEIALVANVEYGRIEGTEQGDDKRGRTVMLQLQLRNSGYYELNGFKGAVDQVLLTFATNEECDGFCQDVANSLQNMPQRLSDPKLRQSDVDKNGPIPQPQKQSRAAMINLSQDAVVGGDNHVFSLPSQIPRKVSTSGAIDVSASTESSAVSTSPLQEMCEKRAANTQLETDGEHLLQDTNCVKNDPNFQIDFEFPTSAKYTKGHELGHDGRQVSGTKKSTKCPVVLAALESFSGKETVGQAFEECLPRNMIEGKADKSKTRPSEAASSHLQHVALEALQHSTEELPTAKPQKRKPSNESEGSNRHSTPEHPSEGAERSSSMPAARANSAKRMTLKPKLAQLHAPAPMLKVRRQPNHAASRTSTTPSRPPLASDAVQSSGADVDWDEDLREDEEVGKHKIKIGKQSKTSPSRGSKTASKKSAADKKDSKGYLSQKKGPQKAKTKEDKTKTAGVTIGLAASRPRRNTANVSYNEQLDPENQSQESVLETTEAASTEPTQQIQAEAPPLDMENDHVDHESLSVNDAKSSDAAGGPVPEHPAISLSREASVEVYDSNRALPAPEISTETIEDDRLITRPSTLREQKGSKTQNGKDIPGRTLQPEVEAVGDSHPMDEQQRARIINAARKSFGSTLTDTINHDGLHPIESHHTETPTKPFGDTAAFAASVKSALEQSVMKPGTNIARSKKRKQDEPLSVSKDEKAATLEQMMANDFVQSAEDKERNPPEDTAHQRLNEKVEHTILPQNTSLAISSTSSWDLRGLHHISLLPSNERSDADESQLARAELLRGSGAGKGSPGLRQIAGKSEPSAKAKSPASGIKDRDRVVTIQPNGRKRGATADFQNPQWAKRARKTDPGPAVQGAKDKLTQSSALPFQPIAHTAPDRNTQSRASNPWSSDVRKVIRSHETPAVSSMLQRSEYAQLSRQRTTISRSPPKLIGSQARTPQHHDDVDHFPLLADDHLLRKAQIVGFSAKGPQNQGVSLSANQDDGLGPDQSKSIPTEIGMHLAFKKMHTDFRPIKRPLKSTSKPSQLFPGDGKRVVNFSFSDQESSDDGIHVNEESTDDRGPSSIRLDLQNGKSASRSSKVDKNGSPRLHLRQVSRLSLPSKDLPAAEEIAAIGASPLAEDIPAAEESRVVEGPPPAIKADAEGFPATGHSPVAEGVSTAEDSATSGHALTAGCSPAVEASSVAEQSPNVSGNMGQASVVDSSVSEGPESDDSAKFGLEAAISNYAMVSAQLNAKSRSSRRKPSIGVGNLLGKNFPEASKSIMTSVFKAPTLTTSSTSLTLPSKSKDANQASESKSVNQEEQVLRAPIDEMANVGRTETLVFDIDQLNVSVAPEQPSSAGCDRVRRLRSSTPESPRGEVVQPVPIESPPSFNTRLGKLIMPPPPRRDQKKLETGGESAIQLCKERERSAMMDAETTLVNGEAFDQVTNLSSPHRPQRSSSSSSDDEERYADFTSQQVAARSLDGDRRVWNQKVTETQQTVLEILEQVSQKILLRFSSAEEGINSKLDHYRYGGRKICNNLVEQYDKRVTEGKEMPTPRISEYHTRLRHTADKLLRARRQVRSGPSLDDLEKSHDRRTTYVLVNLEKIAAAQQA